MKRFEFLALTIAASFAFTACNRPASNGGADDVKAPASTNQAAEGEGDDDGFKLDVPGVKIDASRGKGIDIQAPGVDVKAGGGEGVKVRAPGTDVDVTREKGVQVRTPGADVDVK